MINDERSEPVLGFPFPFSEFDFFDFLVQSDCDAGTERVAALPDSEGRMEPG